MLPFRNLCTCLFVLTAFFLSPMADAQEAVDFAKQIKPILERHCISCHGPDREEGTRLDIRDDAMNYIEVEDAENSVFYEYLISEDEDERMPPPCEGIPLTDEQIETVKTWIDQGAEWPEDIQLRDTSQEAEPGSEPVDDEGEMETGSDPDGDSQDPEDADGSGAKSEQEDKTGQSSQESVGGLRVPLIPGAPKPDRVSPWRKDADQFNADEVTAQTYYNAVGSMHPAIVHIPVGLLLAAGLFALFSLRGNFVMSDCAYYCLWLGTIGAIFACVSGWWFSPMEHRGDVLQFTDIFDDKQPIYWHRLTGLGVTILALLLSLFAAGQRNRDPDDGVLWKLCCILLAAGVAYSGHEGGKLTHGKDHYKDLNKIINTFIPMDQNSMKDKTPTDEADEADGTINPDPPGFESNLDINNDGKSDAAVERAVP